MSDFATYKLTFDTLRPLAMAGWEVAPYVWNPDGYPEKTALSIVSRTYDEVHDPALPYAGWWWLAASQGSADTPCAYDSTFVYEAPPNGAHWGVKLNSLMDSAPSQPESVSQVARVAVQVICKSDAYDNYPDSDDNGLKVSIAEVAYDGAGSASIVSRCYGRHLAAQADSSDNGCVCLNTHDETGIFNFESGQKFQHRLMFPTLWFTPQRQRMTWAPGPGGYQLPCRMLFMLFEWTLTLWDTEFQETWNRPTNIAIWGVETRLIYGTGGTKFPPLPRHNPGRRPIEV